MTRQEFFRLEMPVFYKHRGIVRTHSAKGIEAYHIETSNNKLVSICWEPSAPNDNYGCCYLTIKEKDQHRIWQEVVRMDFRTESEFNNLIKQEFGII